MALAIFDLDNTLLAGDSDHAWGEFLISQGLADATVHGATNDRFYQQYTEGRLDIHAYVRFTLGPVLHLSIAALEELHRIFMREFIEPLMLPKARELIQGHRSAGDYCLIMSATNQFITAPIATALGVDHLLATELEIRDDHYTGNISGIPCFQQGKVARLQQWMANQALDYSLQDACFYSDSINDRPLLEAVARPVAVDPDSRLRAVASQLAWPVISLR
ncbi:MAG: hypothetical protein RLZZ385_2641 [Pseudomonadota bacterium]|jgi:HAD superfamily hydrolase (TIGR01490 family)